MARGIMTTGIVLLIAAAVLLGASPVAYADDGDKHASDTVIDVGISGDVQVDINASGPAELNVGVEGPSEVNIDAGNEVDLNVEASDDAEVFIDGEKFAQPAASQETQDDVWRWNPYVVIISAAFPVLGVLTFIIIGLL